MQSKRYIAAVLLLTSITLLVAFFLWDSEEDEVLEPQIGDWWARGPSDAPVTIEVYMTFT